MIEVYADKCQRLDYNELKKAAYTVISNKSVEVTAFLLPESSKVII